MKKVLLIVIMCVLMLVGCNKTEVNENKNIPTGEKGKVIDVFESTATLPKFSVGMLGIYDGGFNNESLKKGLLPKKTKRS